jgi:hypothetical protein
MASFALLWNLGIAMFTNFTKHNNLGRLHRLSFKRLPATSPLRCSLCIRVALSIVM